MPLRKLCLVLLCLVLTVACLALGKYESTPEATVAGFVKAWNGKDLAGVAKRSVGGNPKGSFKELYAILSKSDWPQITLTNVAIKKSGATASGTATAQVRLGESSHLITDRFILKQSGGEWRIVPRPTNDTSETVLSSLAQIVTFPIAPTKMQAASDDNWCRSNLGEIFTATMIFASERGDVLKIDASRFKSTLAPFIARPEVWHCPADKSGKASYSFNAKVSGKSIDKLKSPKTTVLAYEGVGGKLAFRHAGKATVLFADGHTALVTAAQAKTLRWTP